jgi:hypothetical protein
LQAAQPPLAPLRKLGVNMASPVVTPDSAFIAFPISDSITDILVEEPDDQ